MRTKEIVLAELQRLAAQRSAGRADLNANEALLALLRTPEGEALYNEYRNAPSGVGAQMGGVGVDALTPLPPTTPVYDGGRPFRGIETTLDGLARRRMAEAGLSFSEALRQVAAERPDLYERHRQQVAVDVAVRHAETTFDDAEAGVVGWGREAAIVAERAFRETYRGGPAASAPILAPAAAWPSTSGGAPVTPVTKGFGERVVDEVARTIARKRIARGSRRSLNDEEVQARRELEREGFYTLARHHDLATGARQFANTGVE